jgi:hypothetical protein
MLLLYVILPVNCFAELFHAFAKSCLVNLEIIQRIVTLLLQESGHHLIVSFAFEPLYIDAPCRKSPPSNVTSRKFN